jgi:hypothetical protein
VSAFKLQPPNGGVGVNSAFSALPVSAYVGSALHNLCALYSQFDR